MFKIASIITVGLAALASAQGGIQKDAQWTISALSVNSRPLFSGPAVTSYNFTITAPISQQTAKCSASTRASGGASHLGSLPKTACDPASAGFAFSWTPKGKDGDAGASLDVFNSNTKQRASQIVTPSQIKKSIWVVRLAHGYLYSGPKNVVVQTQDSK